MTQDQTIKGLHEHFLRSVQELRPRLHRYCAHMTGSVSDGEDIVQDVLAHGFFRLATLNDPERLHSWLFRIAYNKCIDFLRSRRVAVVAFDEVLHHNRVDAERTAETELLIAMEVEEALALIIDSLPPKERTSLILKEVFDYSLVEIAEIIESTVGGVKSALSRARKGMRKRTESRRAAAPLNEEKRRVLEAYVDLFNRREWHEIKKVIRNDARLEIVDRHETNGLDNFENKYFGNYARFSWEWRLSVITHAGALAILHSRREAGCWCPYSLVTVTVEKGLITNIRDYVHINYLLDGTEAVARRSTPDDR